MAHAFVLAEAERERCLRRSRRRRALLREANPFDIPESEFVRNYRLTKQLFQALVDELRPYIGTRRRSTGIPVEIKIMAALDFYASGSYQRRVGKDFNLGLSQSSVHKCVAEVTDALNQHDILMRHIRFPGNTHERLDVMKGFMEGLNFPGVVGCIDGTHVAIIRPQHHEEAYYNRKNYHSLNTMIICDVHMNVIHVDASYGGACHDAHVWNRSSIQAHMQGVIESGESCWLLGDSGYAQRDWLMTPIMRAAAGSPEQYYTELHIRVRNTVERCIGLLKARWRCLLAHRTLHYDPVKAGKIVNACVVLHNMCNRARIAVPDLDEEDRSGDVRRQPPQQERHAGASRVATTSRQALVDRLWRERRRPRRRS